MNIYKTRLELTKHRTFLDAGIKVGFVPTMGNLHAGHISLVHESMKNCDTTVVSIFVNPKQFGKNEDLDKYPRTFSDDVEKLKLLHNSNSSHEIIVFAPEDEGEIYPVNYDTLISVPSLNSIIEGADRPGHFDGVTTVLYSLFKLVRPHSAYFGKKDYQQYVIVKKMVKDLMIPVSIVGCDIVRNEMGLALSSRNQYLDEDQQKEALKISSTLKDLAYYIEENYISNGKHNFENIQDAIRQILEDDNWSYLELREAETLNSPTDQSSKLVVLGVYQIEQTRLLDNIEINLKGNNGI